MTTLTTAANETRRVSGVMFLSRKTLPYQRCARISEDVPNISQSQSQEHNIGVTNLPSYYDLIHTPSVEGNL